jgi:hypothetical protein
VGELLTLGGMSITRIIPFLLLAFCGGCFPYHYTTRPGIAGIVVDARTGAPVSSAAVTVSDSRGFAKPGLITTSTNGVFSVPPGRHWGLYFMVGDIGRYSVTTTVQHEGYQPVVMTFTRRTVGESICTNFGDIHLESLTK